MADVSYPTPPTNLSQIPSRTETSQRGQQTVKIVRMSENLKAAPPREPVEGRVIARDRGSSRVTIRTNRGDVDVQLPKDRPLPQRGADVKVQLPPNTRAGQTPATAKVNLPPPSAAKAPEPPPTTPRAQSYQGQLPARPVPQLPPQNGQVVRLTALPPAQLTGLQLPPASQRVASQLPPVLTQTTAQTQTTPLHNFLQPASTPSPAVGLNAAPAASSPPVLNNIIDNLLSQAMNPAAGTSKSTPQNISSFAGQNITPTTTGAPNTQATLTAVQNGALVPPQSQTTVSPQNISTGMTARAANFAKLDMPLLQYQGATAHLSSPGAQHTAMTHVPPHPPGINHPLTSPSTLFGTVIGANNQGQPVISLQGPAQSAPHFFTLQTNSSLPAGTQISFPASTMSASGLTNNLASALPQATNALFTPGSWPAAQEMMDILQQISPQTAQNVMSALPNAAQGNTQMAPAVMLFITAMRGGGDISGWLGQKAQDILRQQGKGDLLQRLGADTATLARTDGAQVSGDWKGMALPLAFYNEIDRIAVFYKQEDSGGEEGKGTKPTRFVFDLSLERMGSVQLDGLFKPVNADNTRLDLVVRTEAELSPSMRQRMRQNYTTVLDYSGLAGDLSFQGDREDFLNIVRNEEHVGLST